MTKRIYMVLMVLGLVACKTTSKVPIDDAYYWPSQTTQTTQTAPNNTPTIQNTPPASEPIEYVNVQDTTVTIRIKR